MVTIQKRKSDLFFLLKQKLRRGACRGFWSVNFIGLLAGIERRDLEAGGFFCECVILCEWTVNALIKG